MKGQFALHHCKANIALLSRLFFAIHHSCNLFPRAQEPLLIIDPVYGFKFLTFPISSIAVSPSSLETHPDHQWAAEGLFQRNLAESSWPGANMDMNSHDHIERYIMAYLYIFLYHCISVCIILKYRLHLLVTRENVIHKPFMAHGDE